MSQTDIIPIAIVEDHALLRKGLSDLMISMGFKVLFCAIHGKDCLAQLEQLEEQPRVIILDIRMPVMDGHETARRVKLLYPEIKIVAYSMNSEEEEVSEILRNGADSFMAKDTCPDVFKTVISRLGKRAS